MPLNANRNDQLAALAGFIEDLKADWPTFTTATVVIRQEPDTGVVDVHVDLEVPTTGQLTFAVHPPKELLCPTAAVQSATRTY